MPLMDRIKVRDFLSLSEPEQLNLVDTVRNGRAEAIVFALKQKKKKIKRKPVKKRAKSPRAQASKKTKAENALSKLTPEQIAKLAKLF